MSNAIDDILEMLDDVTATKTEVEVEEVVEIEEIKLAPTEWEDLGDDKRTRLVPFSKLYWKPKGGKDFLVRVFEGYDFDEVDYTYIPPHKDFEVMARCMELGLKQNIIGPTGCGKTLMFEYYASTTGRPFLRIEHNQDLDKAGVFGQIHINKDDDGVATTDFIPGVLPRSMDEPTLVVLDELTRATGYANMIYQRLLDRRELAMPEMKDTTVSTLKPHKYWLIAASDNTKGNGDDMDKYPMSNVQDGAFLNRWDIIIEADYLTHSQETKLVQAWASSLQPSEAKSLAKFSGLMHSGYKKGDINTAFSPRNLACICKLIESGGFTMRQAIEMNYLSRVSESEYSDVTESLNAVFGR